MILLQFVISDVALHLAGNTPTYPEFDPILHVYTSSDLGPMKTSQNQEELEQALVIPLTCASEIQTLYLPNAIRLRESSSIVFGLYANSVQDGIPYLVPCGTAVCCLENLRKRGQNVTIPLNLTDPHPKIPVKKGSLVVTFRKMVWDIEKEVVKSPWICIPGSDKEKEWMENMNTYVLSVMGMFLTKEEDRDYGIVPPTYQNARKYRPSHPKLRQIHCPYYQMEMMGRRLPGFAYSWIIPKRKPDESYYINLIHAALKLCELEETDFLSAVEGQFDVQKITVDVGFKMALDVVGTACCMYSQGQLYVPDHVNTYTQNRVCFDVAKHIQDVENMNNLRVTHGNDCEDMGEDNVITALTLKNYELWSHPLTLACQRVLKQFLVLLPHGAVATASAAESKCDGKPEKDTQFIAHIFCMLIPYGRVKKMLERTNTDPSLLGVPNEIPAWSDRLDVVFCEGTGRVSAILRPKWEWSNHDRNWYVETVKSQAEFEKQNPQYQVFNILQVPLVAHPKNTYDYNCFYRYVVAAFVPANQGATVGDVTFVYADDEEYGVLVHDLVYDQKNPALAIPETLTDSQKNFIEECLLSAHPIPQLHCRSENKIKDDIAFLERVVGLTPWKEGKQCKDFGYFFTLEELRRDYKKIKFRGFFEASYKYFGLDNTTAYIELCISEK